MSEVHFEIVGALNEGTELPTFTDSKVIVDMGRLTHVNSIGIKRWCEWLSEHQSTKQVWLIHIPYAFGRHLSVVRGVVAQNVWIRSIFVPFYSEGLKTRLDVLFSHGVEYDDQNVVRVPEPRDAKGNYMEVDVRLDSYFNFLKHLKDLRQDSV